MECADIEPILDVENLPESYKNLDFPREQMVPLTPFGVYSDFSGSHENELHALRTELAALRDVAVSRGYDMFFGKGL